MSSHDPSSAGNHAERLERVSVGGRTPGDGALRFFLDQDWTLERVDKLSARALAYLGDSVFELGLRLRHVASGTGAAGKMHESIVHLVCATNQARLFDRFFPQQSEADQQRMKTWRNAKQTYRSTTVSKGTLARSTAFEAWVGFLFLTRQTGRLEEVWATAVAGGDLATAAGEEKS